jgi:hypothetical protein
MIVVLAVVAVMAIRPSDADRTALSERRPLPGVSAGGFLGDLRFPNGSPVTEPQVPTATQEPSAAVEPDSMASDGEPCASGTARPVLNTVRPVLSARMTGSVRPDVEIKKENAIGYVNLDAGDLTTRDGLVTLYLHGSTRLELGESYRWRIRGTAADRWSSWCEFAIAAATLDSLNLGNDRVVTAGLPPSRWRDITAVLGPGWPNGDTPLFWSIQAAGGRVSAGEVSVSLRGWDWGTVIESMAEWASARNDPELWRLVDVLSAKLGGPPHPTLGFPRA